MEIFWKAIVEAGQLLVNMDKSVFQVILLSIRVSGTAVLISILIGMPLGFLLGLTRFRGRGLLAALVNTGLGFPPVVIGLFVYMSLSRSGPLGSLGLLFSPTAMVIAQVVLATPYITAITMSAVGSVPRDVRLQAMGLGASRLQVLWLIMRDARVSLMAAVIAGFGAVISEVGAVMMVGGNISTSDSNVTRVMTTAIVEETTKGRYSTALALGLVLLGIVFVVNLLLTHQQQGLGGRWLNS